MVMLCCCLFVFFCQAEDGIRDLVRSRGLGDVYKRQVQVHGDDGFADLLDAPRVGHLARVLDLEHGAVVELHLVDDAGRGGDEVLVELAFQALLHDLHVQQAEKAAAEAETQRLTDLGLETQAAVVELELFQRIAQLVVFAGLGGIQPCDCLLYTSPSPRDRTRYRMPSSA